MKPKLKRHRTKPIASYYFKSVINSFFNKLGKSSPFKISTLERISSSSALRFPNQQINNLKRLWRISFMETLIGSNIVIFLACVIIALIWGRVKGSPQLGDLLVEFWGLIFDVFVILVAYGVIQHRKQLRDDIARQEEIIEDLKGWGSDEAKHRVFGAIRRLSKMGKTTFELSGANINNVKFRAFGVSSISGSTLSSGGSWMGDEVTVSNFNDVDFSRLNAKDTVFEKASILSSGEQMTLLGDRARYTDCNFSNSCLRGSTFDGAKLIWSDKPPKTLYEVVDEEPNGHPIRTRIIMDRFNDSDLAGTSFQYCQFKWADFREAIDIEAANFCGAEGLETCIFDNEHLKQRIIARAKSQHNKNRKGKL